MGMSRWQWAGVCLAFASGVVGCSRDTVHSTASLIGSSADPSPVVAFVQNALAVGLDRANEPPSAAACPPAGITLSYGTFLVDLDGDGRLDVYDVNHGQQCHRSGLWLNGGTGSFGSNLFTVAVQRAPQNGASLDSHEPGDVRRRFDRRRQSRPAFRRLERAGRPVREPGERRAHRLDRSQLPLLRDDGSAEVRRRQRRRKARRRGARSRRRHLRRLQGLLQDAADHLEAEQRRSQHQHLANRRQPVPLRGAGRAGRVARLQQGRPARPDPGRRGGERAARSLRKQLRRAAAVARPDRRHVSPGHERAGKRPGARGPDRGHRRGRVPRRRDRHHRLPRQPELVRPGPQRLHLPGDVPGRGAHRAALSSRRPALHPGRGQRRPAGQGGHHPQRLRDPTTDWRAACTSSAS